MAGEMEKPVKLTKPQRALLANLADHPQLVSPVYAPAFNLLRRGLIEGAVQRYGAMLFTITPAGRAALTAATGHQQ